MTESTKRLITLDNGKLILVVSSSEAGIELS
jgi:hypothetical protein